MKSALLRLLHAARLRHDPNGFDRPADRSFHIEAPWIVGRESTFRLTLRDRKLRGSRRHFVRFDLYPLFSPLHKSRHHGFWDMPARDLVNEVTLLSFSGDDLLMHSPGGTHAIRPVWRSSLPLLGYAMLHVSLWDTATSPPQQMAVKPSMHVFWDPGRDLPLEFAFISLTQRCNLSCPMCMRHNRKHWENADVSSQVLDAFLSASPGLQSVFLGGIGEPLLYGRLAETIEDLKKRMPSAGQVGMNTNGMLMGADRAARLFDAGLDWVCFSVDGARKETVEQIRTGADFDLLLNNIAGAAEYRQRSGRAAPWLTANYVIQDANAEEVVSFVKLAKSLGLDSVQFSHRRDFKAGEFRMLADERIAPIFAEAAAAGRSEGITVTLPALQPSGDFRCRFMQSAYLWLQGDVVPCCRMLPGAYPGTVHSFGRVVEFPLHDIWNGAGYKSFREGVLSGDHPAVCRQCPYAAGLLT